MLSENVPITAGGGVHHPLSLVVASSLPSAAMVTSRARALRGEQTALVNEMIEGQKVVQAFGHEAETLPPLTR